MIHFCDLQGHWQVHYTVVGGTYNSQSIFFYHESFLSIVTNLFYNLSIFQKNQNLLTTWWRGISEKNRKSALPCR